MRLLKESGRGDLVGVLHRVLLEAHMLGLYVLHGGDEALNLLMGDHRRNVGVLAERNDLPLIKAEVAAWNLPNSRVKVEAVASDLGPMLQAVGDLGADVDPTHQLGYRAESTFSIHGAGPALRYMDHSHPDRLGILVDGHETKPGSWGTTMLGAIHTLYLARAISDAFGIDTSSGDALHADLADFLEQERSHGHRARQPAEAHALVEARRDRSDSRDEDKHHVPGAPGSPGSPALAGDPVHSNRGAAGPSCS
jgi:hypothetical protein